MKQQTSIKLSGEQAKHLQNLRQSPTGAAAAEVVSALQRKGYEAYWAGGCVRDLVMGKTPADFDVACNASPEEVENLFAKTIPVGKQFGIIIVQVGLEQIEVARFRGEKNYLDGRHPSEVYFTNAKEDAERRDFTMNALFLDLENEQILDFVGGLDDIQENTLRAVGLPEKRFSEDHLRILRALRFCSQLGCQMEKSLELAVIEQMALIRKVSPERIFSEWEKLLRGTDCKKILRWMAEKNLVSEVFPNVVAEVEKLDQLSFEEPWIEFWLWLLLSGSGEARLRKCWSEQKASREWVQQMERALFWFFDPQAFASRSMGEILELSFERGSLEGLRLWGNRTSGPLFERFQKFLKHRARLGPALPPPLLRGGDLASRYVGAVLGQKLKLTYWAQLEGLVSSKDAALAFAETAKLA